MNDDRPIRKVHYYKGVIRWIDVIRQKYRDDPAFNADMRRRLDYVEGVINHGNVAGRHNITIDLPVPWRLADIEKVLGVDDDHPPASGTEASWRAVRRHYDVTQSGRAVGGRTV